MELQNTLSRSTSQYLRDASEQPVHWQSFSEEAFRAAAEMDRPILLDIGAVWCHWCHVMDHESYADPRVAGVINDNFIPVKVDRDQMPDVDARYQAAVGAITGSGGWPLTVFLTPEGKAFYGGTYFPREDSQGRPGLLSLLPQIAEAYHRQKHEVQRSAEELFQQLNEYYAGSIRRGTPSPDIAAEILSAAKSQMDPQFGGFGKTPKFFNATVLHFLIESAAASRDNELIYFLKLTLDGIMQGGVYDQVGGGFHRYSVDRYWHVPHFEKMLYDNALMVQTYLRAAELTGNPAYARVATETADWITGPMKSPEGPFYAHQDADIGAHDDGSYWTWTMDEFGNALSEEERRVAFIRFDVRENPSDIAGMSKRNVLRIAAGVEELATELSEPPEKIEEMIARSKGRLLKARQARKGPFIDRTFYTDRNGLAISALVEASIQLKSKAYYRDAEKAASFILSRMVDGNGKVAHAFAEDMVVYDGLLDDQVYLGIALLDLFDAMRSDEHLVGAERLATVLLDQFEDKAGGGFYDRGGDSKGDGYLVSKRKPSDDIPTPAGNSAAAIFFDRLYSITENRGYFDAAQRTLEAFAGSAAKLGMYAATYARALSLHFLIGKTVK